MTVDGLVKEIGLSTFTAKKLVRFSDFTRLRQPLAAPSTGSDKDMTVDGLVKEIGLSSFTAKKLVRLRDAFWAGGPIAHA